MKGKLRFGFRIMYAVGIVSATTGVIEKTIIVGLVGLMFIIVSSFLEDVYEGRF